MLFGYGIYRFGKVDISKISETVLFRGVKIAEASVEALALASDSNCNYISLTASSEGWKSMDSTVVFVYL